MLGGASAGTGCAAGCTLGGPSVGIRFDIGGAATMPAAGGGAPDFETGGATAPSRGDGMPLSEDARGGGDCKSGCPTVAPRCGGGTTNPAAPADFDFGTATGSDFWLGTAVPISCSCRISSSLVRVAAICVSSTVAEFSCCFSSCWYFEVTLAFCPSAMLRFALIPAMAFCVSLIRP